MVDACRIVIVHTPAAAEWLIAAVRIEGELAK
jgi:hypothetical protein